MYKNDAFKEYIYPKYIAKAIAVPNKIYFSTKTIHKMICV